MEELLRSLSAQGGLLGTLLAISILANGTLGALLVKTVNMLLDEKDKRTEDASKYRDDLAEPVRKVGTAMEDMANQMRINNRDRL